MTVHRIVPILNVSSVPASLAWFAQLGWETSFTWDADDPRDEPGFGGTRFGVSEIFLCRECQGSRGEDGAWMSWFLHSHDEVDALHAHAFELGLDVVREPKDEPWGVYEFHLRHPDGHRFRVGAFAAQP